MNILLLLSLIALLIIALPIVFFVLLWKKGLTDEFKSKIKIKYWLTLIALIVFASWCGTKWIQAQTAIKVFEDAKNYELNGVKNSFGIEKLLYAIDIWTPDNIVDAGGYNTYPSEKVCGIEVYKLDARVADISLTTPVNLDELKTHIREIEDSVHLHNVQEAVQTIWLPISYFEKTMIKRKKLRQQTEDCLNLKKKNIPPFNSVRKIYPVLSLSQMSTYFDAINDSQTLFFITDYCYSEPKIYFLNTRQHLYFVVSFNHSSDELCLTEN